MNYVMYFNIAAIITCIVLLIIVNSEYRKTRTIRSTILNVILYLTILLAISGIITYNVSNNFRLLEVGKNVRIMGMYVYFITHVGLCLAVFFYNYFLIRPYDKADGKTDLIYFMPFIAALLLLSVNWLTKWIFTVDENLTIHMGQHIWIIYLIELYYAYLIVVTIFIRHRKEIGNHKLIPSLFYVAIMIAGIGMQFYYRELQLESFAIAIGAIVLVMNVQNPREIIDTETKVLNYGCFKEEIYKNINHDRNFDVLYIYFGEMEAYRTIYENRYYTELLHKVGSIMKSIRKNVLLFRIKKDIFTIIYPRDEIAYMDDDVDAINELFVNAVDVQEKSFRLSPVMLVLKYPRDIANMEDIMEDTYILQEKFRYYKGGLLTAAQLEFDRLKEKKRFEKIIKKIAREKKINIVCIPIYRTRDNNIISAYASILLDDYFDGDISYSDFIKKCGKNEKIIDIENDMLNVICNMLNDNNPILMGAKNIGISLSNIHFMQDGMVDSILRILRKHNVDTSSISFGISGEVLNNMNITTRNNIESLESAGIGIFLEEYGVGKSNLDNLTTMKVGYIEMDSSITDAIYANEKYETILRRQIEVAHKLETKILIGGLKDLKQVEKLKELNADYYKLIPMQVNDMI